MASFERVGGGSDQATGTVGYDAPIGPLQLGDLVLWGTRWAVVGDIAAFAGGETYVTVTFVDGRGLPLCVTTGDLAGAEVRRPPRA